MKVLHVGAGNIYGGVERALVAYAAAGNLSEPQLQQEFAVTFPGQLNDELLAEDVDVALLGPARLSNPLSVASARRAMRALLERSRPDAVVTHGPWVHSLIGSTVRRFGVAGALALHSPPQLNWLDLLARSNPTDLVITYSHFTSQASKWWLGRIPVVTCTYPVRPHSPAVETATREQLGIPLDSVVILQVGRLDAYKGHQLHLQALARIASDRNWLALFAGGAGSSQTGYARKIRRLRDELQLADRVRLLGHRKDVPSLLALADVFCHPNVRPEAFGLVFVEAMQAGLPVVATRMGGAQEILGEGGGILVEPTPNAVASALGRVTGDAQYRREIGRRGQVIAASRYSLTRGLRELGVVLAGLLTTFSRPGKTRWE